LIILSKPFYLAEEGEELFEAVDLESSGFSWDSVHRMPQPRGATQMSEVV
jgi:hypothetical protein